MHDWMKLHRFLPLIDTAKVATGTENEFIRDWIKHPTYDDYWRKMSAEDKFAKFNVPIYNLAGWGFDAYPAAEHSDWETPQVLIDTAKVEKTNFYS